jgi:hypothetical protein
LVSVVDQSARVEVHMKLRNISVSWYGRASWWGTRARDRLPLYSRKLHMRVRRARTSWETSLMIFALSLGERVVNHLARR